MIDVSLAVTALSIAVIVLTLLVIFFGVNISVGDLIDKSRGKLKLSRFLKVWDNTTMTVNGDVTQLSASSTLQDISQILSSHLRVAFIPDNFVSGQLVVTDDGFDLKYSLGSKHPVFYGMGILHINYIHPQSISILFPNTDLGKIE